MTRSWERIPFEERRTSWLHYKDPKKTSWILSTSLFVQSKNEGNMRFCLRFCSVSRIESTFEESNQESMSITNSYKIYLSSHESWRVEILETQKMKRIKKPFPSSTQSSRDPLHDEVVVKHKEFAKRERGRNMKMKMKERGNKMRGNQKIPLAGIFWASFFSSTSVSRCSPSFFLALFSTERIIFLPFWLRKSFIRCWSSLFFFLSSWDPKNSQVCLYIYVSWNKKSFSLASSSSSSTYRKWRLHKRALFFANKVNSHANHPLSLSLSLLLLGCHFRFIIDHSNNVIKLREKWEEEREDNFVVKFHATPVSSPLLVTELFHECDFSWASLVTKSGWERQRT